jgi:hypothetical protein
LIERETKSRFRYPATLTGLDRVNIRNVRLILEGHVVAHPTDNQVGAKINGKFDPTTLEVLLNGQPGWIKWQASPRHVMVLGQVIELSELAVGGPARLSEDNIAAVRAAIDQGSTDGIPLTFRLDPDDRLRIWMPGRLKREVLWMTPWNLPGIEQPSGTLAAIVSDESLNDADGQGLAAL